MPRLRRRLRLLDEWKEQIRGGLWYKPAWWDAVRNVPPLPAPARVKKSDVPTIRFVEEQLIKCVLRLRKLLRPPAVSAIASPSLLRLFRRDFASKNPSIAQYDAQAMIEDAENQSLRSVAATFAKRQVAEMQAGEWRKPCCACSVGMATIPGAHLSQERARMKLTVLPRHGCWRTGRSITNACRHQRRFRKTWCACSMLPAKANHPLALRLKLPLFADLP